MHQYYTRTCKRFCLPKVLQLWYFDICYIIGIKRLRNIAKHFLILECHGKKKDSIFSSSGLWTCVSWLTDPTLTFLVMRLFLIYWVQLEGYYRTNVQPYSSPVKWVNWNEIGKKKAWFWMSIPVPSFVYEVLWKHFLFWNVGKLVLQI